MATAMQSAVRLPSPDAADGQSHTSGRKRSPSSRSPSPERRPPTLRTRSTDPDAKNDPSPPRDRSRSPLPHRNGPLPRDVDRQRALERQRQAETRRREEVKEDKPLSAAEKQAAAKAEYERLLTMRSGGTYVPPAKLRALQAEIGNDPSSKEFQRMAWEALKKSINGLINKVNVSNIKYIVPELFSENLIRGRGLFCRSIMKAQAASLPFTPIYAAMVAIVNTKLPQVGELLVNRLIVQFRKAFKRNDKAVCLSSTTFVAHLINQQVAHEMLAAQILLLLLNKPTDDSVEIAVGLMREVGQHIEEFNAQIAMAVYDQFRSILHEADIDKRTQYMVEVLFQVRKDRYKDNPAVKEELDLVEEEDQITHNTGLDDQIEVQDGLNVFKFDADWEANEEAYKKLRAEILGEADGSDEDDEDGSDVSSSEDEDDEEVKQVEIKDQSNTDLVNLRRTIYLTIMSSGGFEECTHKLLRINLPPGLEHELPSMIVECCSQERTYNKFFGLIGERLCKINRMWNELFEASFVKYYDTIHRLETNRLRIVAQFFGHLLSSDAIGWHVISAIHLNEEETTSSSRIFIKILIEELAQNVGMKKLSERMKDDALLPALGGIFPVDNPRNTRFSINFFTAIGMGVLTEGMREYLKNMPKPTLPALPVRAASPSDRSVSSYSSYSSYSSRSRSPSRSPSRTRGRARSYTRSPTPPRRSVRDRSHSYSRSPSRSRSPPPRRRSPSASVSRSRTPERRRRYTSSISRSRSPAPKRTKGRRDSRSLSYSRSRSPPARGAARARSYSRSASPPARRAAARDRSYSRSATPPRRRRGSYSRSPARSISRSRSPPPRKAGAGRRRSPSRSISLSPPPRRTRSPVRAQRCARRNTSSPEVSRSRSPPRRAQKPSDTSARGPKPPAPSGEMDLSDIHPSRRGLLGAGGRARPTAGDFI
ncbi:MIF4G-domain-containing protein [Aureobasidium pullulans]|uniref:Pre-mRNA-splicing factor CWC22 n=1 Tax=Aureobasidium pullulans TaxID=5580 RepID=A0A4S9V085_AURPU|nr:MIF4G-domain-containing protein [Aureobasidium pullulans]THZ44879.1 MIF4G-domain-containing protein [Aureobasidium pullulans]THZ61438.1 MIF4G-domain-containing protein [Aureobasidium pullulans]THZ99399.1 MIF4G-domain-containing protein [Aureobasidium pullulans]